MLTFNLAKKLMNKITEEIIAAYITSTNIIAFTETFK